MAADSLLAALVGNYGDPEHTVDNVSTVRGLLSFCKKWPEGLVGAEELNNPCLEMAMRLREGASQMEQSLRQNPAMTLRTSSPISRTAQAYVAIAEVLEELPQLAVEGETEDFLDNIDLFEEERLAVLEAQEQIELHLSGKVPLCPRCGSGGEEPLCSSCSLIRLYPNPSALRDAGEADGLEGSYGLVYRAYRQSILGECSLSVLWSALDGLQEHLEELLATRKQLARRLEDEPSGSSTSSAESEMLEALLAAAETDIKMGLAGVEKMREAEESQRVYDLSRGWEDIFYAFQAIEVTASRIQRELSEDEGEGFEDDEPSPSSSTGDQVSFSAE